MQPAASSSGADSIPVDFGQQPRRVLHDLGQSIAWQPSGGVCDGNNIAACGVPVVDTMGVRGGKIHSTEEFLIVDSLKERAALSALTVLRLAAEAAWATRRAAT